jgi:lytic cellulose monooxygenase (C1-hydroxylating)
MAISKVFFAAILVALCFQNAYSHTYLSSVYLNNQLLNEGDCVRPHPSTAYDSPIPLVTSPDMTCGWLPSASNPASRKCPIAAGSTIGVQWHHQSNSPSDDIIDPTHAGPIIFYLAKSDTGSGNVWFKIYEDGFSGGKWGVDRMLDKKGRVDVTLPTDIAPGNYLLRGEILALHGAYALNGVQPYVGCIELTISGSGTANPTGVALPGYYKNSDPGMLFNRYQSFTSYPIPGPALYKSGSSGSPTTAPTTAPTTKPTAAPTTAPTTKPTAAPTTAPTTKPTAAPTTLPTTPARPTVPSSSDDKVKVTVYSSASTWWLALTVSSTVSKVEIKDAGKLTSYVAMTANTWGSLVVYTYAPQGSALVAPVSVRITGASGKTAFATITSISPNSVFEASGTL